MNLDDTGGGYTITAYQAGRVIINDRAFTRSLIVTRDTLVDDWPPAVLDELAQDHLEHVLELQPEVILLGTGERLSFPDPRLLNPVMGRGIGLEVMDTAAACRTYNVLMAEGRQVAAALILGNS